MHIDSCLEGAGVVGLISVYDLGLEALHLMTNFKTYQLRADMLDWDEHSQYALYSSIQVADAGDFYKLTLSSKSGGEAGT